MHQPAVIHRSPREWRLSPDVDRPSEAPLVNRVLPLVVLGLFVVACTVPLAATFYLLAWPVLNEPNSAVPGMLGALALFAVAVGAIVLVLRVLSALGRG